MCLHEGRCLWGEAPAMRESKNPEEQHSPVPPFPSSPSFLRRKRERFFKRKKQKNSFFSFLFLWSSLFFRGRGNPNSFCNPRKKEWREKERRKTGVLGWELPLHLSLWRRARFKEREREENLEKAG